MRWLLLSLSLLACKPTPYQLGMKAANEGRYLDANYHWIRQLDRDVNQVKPRAAITEYSPDAWEELIEVAQEHEASRRYADAVATYDKAIEFADELIDLELLTFDVDNVKQERVALEQRWAQAEWAWAIQADQEQRFEDAMKHYAVLRELRPEHPEVDSRQGLTYLLWAESDLAAKRYSQAAEHYRNSYELTRNPTSSAWAAAIEVALGRYGLQQGKCRYAVERFEAAGKVEFDPGLPADRARAEDCARLGLLIEPLEAQVELKVDDMAVGTMLIDRIEREIERQGSRYLVFLHGQTENQPQRRVEVGGRVTQALVEPPKAAAREESVEGFVWVACSRETLAYDPEAVCADPVQVTYRVERRAVTVRLSGTVRIVDPAAGERKTRPLEITLQHDTTHASDFKAGGEPIQVAALVTETEVEIPGTVLALKHAPGALPSGNEVLRDAVALLAEEAGRVVVEAVDFEEPPPEPTHLQVRDPLMMAGDLEFAQPGLKEPEEPFEATIQSLPGPDDPPAEPTEPTDGTPSEATPESPAPDGPATDDPPASPTPTEPAPSIPEETK